MKPCKFWRTVAVSFGALTLAIAAQAQTVTNPCPNRVISWNADNNSTVNPANLAGLAAATNWVDSWPSDINIGLPDNTGATTTMNKGSYSFNTYSIGNHPGLDANGTANREMLNGYLSSGPAGWNPWTTNTWVSLTNVPYAKYDVVVYLSSDTSGRHGSIDDGTMTYYFSTVGTSERSGVNALFVPTTETNSSTFPSADFAFFPGMTNANPIFTEHPKSGNDQWLGIAAFQVIEASNVYVLYGPAPASLTISAGQPASFSVMAGGQNPAYQWRHAGTNILNATNATYSIASTTIGQNGNYDVIVTNSFSSMTSVVSTLTFYAPKTVTWDGNGSTWDVSSLYWTINGGASTTNYADTDNVRFDPLGIAQSTVYLSGSLNPSSIVISNASYTLTSSGTIGGSGPLHLMNNASVILDCVDTRTAPTIVDSGCTYQVDNYDSAGQMPLGVLTNNGTLLFYANASEAYGFPIYGSGSITNFSSAGTITLGSDVNANYLVQAGAGYLLLQGSNTLAGGLTVSSGFVIARSESSLGKSQVVLLAGGELQLLYGFDYVGSSMTLAGGLLHSLGATYEGPVMLTVDSTIQVDSGTTLTLNNAAGLNGGSFNLLEDSTGTLILLGTNNTWASITIYGGTLQIGNGGAGGSLGGGTITDSGALNFDLAGNLVVTNPITSFGAINQIGAGTVTLTADNTAAEYSGLISITNGTLLINGTCGSGGVYVVGGTLGGTGTIDGLVLVMPGAALGPSESVGTLTINNSLALSGNLSIDVHKSLSQSNDFINVSGSLDNTGSGVVTVHNLGPALAVGDKFTLFNKAVTGGDTLTVTGGGAVWTNKLAADGSIAVLSITTLPHPVITDVHLAAGATNIVFSGTNGLVSGNYNVLSSTNLAQTNWTVEATGTFDGSGNFSVTNLITPGTPQKFYRLQLP